ncbi:MAG: hypothetical protein DRO07_01535 [Candidatus Iainarchaeum archaeon]|uniref:DUF2065 family protein n=1 Tax=Candidatus Iainarchaeum sp. TaxID=3101447 RepID=A0A497JG45_9ARCH|nr:MAG: hypothetical protein DRO07_01535 [Candidatus Diapherotrites archaeon]
MAVDVTFFLAQFWGWLLVIVGLIFLLRPRVLLNEISGLFKDRNYVLLTGWLAMILGLFTVILHNVWTADWRVVITVFGWLSLIKGIARMGFPELPQKTASAFKNKQALMQILLVICVLLGAWLIWMSYSQ